MTSAFLSLFTAFVLLVTLASFASAKARRILLYTLVFMTMAGIQVQVPLVGSGMRSYLAFLLLILSRGTVASGMSKLDRIGVLRPLAILCGYLVLSHIFLSQTPTFKTAFEHAGNFVFFVLTASFLGSSSEREVSRMMLATGLGLFANVVQYMPAWIPFLSGYELLGPVPHYQEPASSGLLLLPILLSVLHATRGRFRRFLTLCGVAFLSAATFITGARAPSGVFVVILALYRRSIWWALLVLGAGAAVFASLPQTTQTERMISRMEQLTQAARTGTLAENPDAGMRLGNVRIAFQGFEQRPIFGWGVGSWFGYRQQRTGLLGYSLSVHNGWALLFFETGLFGVLTYLFLVWKCIRGVPLRFTRDFADNLGYVGVLGTVAVLLISLGGDALLVRASFCFFSFAAAWRMRRRFPPAPPAGAAA